MPAGQLHTALSAVVVDVFQGGHQVRETSETAAAAKNGRPTTIFQLSVKCSKSFVFFFDNAEHVVLGSGLDLGNPLTVLSFR
jgi:hypothetical protein